MVKAKEKTRFQLIGRRDHEIPKRQEYQAFMNETMDFE